MQLTNVKDNTDKVRKIVKIVKKSKINVEFKT